MIGLPVASLAWIALIVVLGYSVYGLTGFGSSIVAVPLLVLFVPLRFAVPMMLVFDLCTGLLLAWRSRRHLSRAEVFRLLPFLLIGMFGGLTLLIHVPERWLLLMLGSFTFGYAAWSLVRRSEWSAVSPVWAIPAGLFGGAFTALYGTGGPIYTIYLTKRLADKRALRATIGALIFCTAVCRLVLFTGSGFYAQRGLLPLAFMLIPFAFLGFLIGSAGHQRLSGPLAQRMVWSLLLVSGAGLVWRVVGA